MLVYSLVYSLSASEKCHVHVQRKFLINQIKKKNSFMQTKWEHWPEMGTFRQAR